MKKHEKLTFYEWVHQVSIGLSKYHIILKSHRVKELRSIYDQHKTVQQAIHLLKN